MKTGITTSAMAHVAVLGFAMVSLGSPKALEVPDVEALPVDIIPIESLTKNIQGEKKADLAKKPAPKPTVKPPTPRPVPAENIGETEVDKKAEADVVKEAPPVEKTAAPEPRPAPQEPPKPEAVSTPELAAEPTQKTDIAALVKQADPVETSEPVEEPKAEAVDKPLKSVPVPKVRPQRPKPETKATNKRTKTDTAKTESKTSDNQKTEDKVAALLNKADANASGAKRSNDEAALGTKKSNNAVKLSQSEVDALRGQIQACWNVAGLAGVEGSDKLRAKVIFKLGRDGTIDGRPKATASGGDNRTNRTFAGSARRAVMGCAPYELPNDKYETWADVEVNFSLKDML